MNILHSLKHAFIDHCTTLFNLDPTLSQQISFTLNTDESKAAFGDLSSNAAMMIAKAQQQIPRTVAQKIVDSFTHEHIARIEIAGPGFLNLFLTPQAFTILACALAQEKEDFFKLPAHTPRKKFSLEFVSANPTGPLHLGHGRGGIIGDVLGTLLNFIGHSATKEFYINDAGSQIAKLGSCLKIRCQQALGMDVQLPEDGYAGEYLIETARTCVEQYGEAVLSQDDAFFQEYGKTTMLAMIKETLINYGIHYDVWFSELTLHQGDVVRTLEKLKERKMLYEQDGALWFTSTAFGDDKDRVMRKSDGEYTYVAADSAYLQNKADRGFDHLIMVLGQDHHSYVVRLEGLRQALGLRPPLDIILYQLVSLKEGDEQIRMSKRTGRIVSLADVINTVGPDVARFFYLNKKADAQLEFDVSLALKKTEENPVYYIQYAYVRTNSILTKAANEPALTNITAADAAHMAESERMLLKKIASLQHLLETISTNYQTHALTYYTTELAQAFHSYYAKNRAIDPTNITQSRGRLLLITLVRNTLGTCLHLLGISKPESM